MNIKNQVLLGAHVSIAGGFFKAIDEGIEIGCTAIQIFTKSNRQWAAKPIEQDDAHKFIQAQKNSPIKTVIAHASYLINLGSLRHDVQKKSLDALIDEIERCHLLQIPYLVVHPGTVNPVNKEDNLRAIGDLINDAVQATKDCSTTVLIETMAGQGNSAGSSFEELALMIGQVENKKRIGVCFDTCHVFVAGYDFSTQTTYTATFEKFDSLIGLHYLKAFHINDSKKELNSRVDRHENIGEGMIPLKAFTMIMNDPAFAMIPKIVETPVTTDGLTEHKKNVQTLLSLIA